MSERTRLGVLGWPVAHSRSPAMQNAALRAAGLGSWRYQLLPVPPECFDETVRALPAAGFRGANVTIPHKRAALALSDERSPRARAIGAANTLLFSAQGAVEADNTDAPALIEALPLGITGASALVLGAGGSARAAVWALLDAGAAEVRVYNRTVQRARELCEDLGATHARAIEAADVLVNCTSVGLHAGSDGSVPLPLPAELIGHFSCVVDFVYREGGTPLINRARELGVDAVDGLQLLAYQGALSFAQFTGRAAPLAAMQAALGLHI